MFHLYTLCLCVCACVCVLLACLYLMYLPTQTIVVTCCTCMTSDSSQTGLTKTAPRSPGCSDWKPQNTSGTMRKIAPAFFSEVHVGHCPPRHFKRGGGWGGGGCLPTYRHTNIFVPDVFFPIFKYLPTHLMCNNILCLLNSAISGGGDIVHVQCRHADVV